ncbi:MAG: lactoylglutathione lyase [Gammaproteobacteria bacterium]|nr:lactoylglutathione lyase [Gammaproteobacteria bacterium]|tara:strand:- start:352 stop:774 length:423 start_codon:yes stop_codon:yes gene_type:complete
MNYLHTMLRITNIEESLDFFCNKFGLVEKRRHENEAGRFTLIFLSTENGRDPELELTFNWDGDNIGESSRNFGHLAYEVNDIYKTCEALMNKGVTINRPPRDGRMAFIKSPDNISIELLQRGKAKFPEEPWVSMENSGTW